VKKSQTFTAHARSRLNKLGQNDHSAQLPCENLELKNVAREYQIIQRGRLRKFVFSNSVKRFDNTESVPQMPSSECVILLDVLRMLKL